jgi:hypothetical protein
MAFRVRQPTQRVNNTQQINEKAKKAEDIDLEPITLKNYRNKFLYYPNQTGTTSIEIIQPKTRNEYEEKFRPTLHMMNKPEYEKEKLIYDDNSKEWKLVKESDLYKYES